MVLTAVAVITVLIVQLNYTGRIALTLSSNSADELSAYYLARSSVNVALLRLAILKKLRSFKIGNMDIPKEVLDLVWNIPFIFPPPPALLAMGGVGGDGKSGGEDDLSLSMKDMLAKIKKDNAISKVGSFEHKIRGMDSKINVNLIATDQASIERFKAQMKNSYTIKVDKDESFAHRYPIEDFDRVLNSIIDWIDVDTDSRNGGDENTAYERHNPPYKARNGPMVSLSELHMVDGVTDELYNFISPYLSVFSSDAINVNNATPAMWKTIDGRLTDDEIKLIMEKIEKTGPFRDEKDLQMWIGQNTSITATSFNTTPVKILLAFEDKNYMIEANGYSHRVTKSITCYVSETYSEMMLQGKVTPTQQAQTPGQTTPQQPTQPVQPSVPNPLKPEEKPTIVYWEMN